MCTTSQLLGVKIKLKPVSFRGLRPLDPRQGALPPGPPLASLASQGEIFISLPTLGQRSGYAPDPRRTYSLGNITKWTLF